MPGSNVTHICLHIFLVFVGIVFSSFFTLVALHHVSPVPIACLCLSLISHIFILTTLLSLPSICFTRPFLHLYSDPTFDSLRSCQILILGREAILTPDGDGLMSIYGLCTLPFHFTCLTELSKANMLFAQISRVLSWIARSFPYPPKSFG